MAFACMYVSLRITFKPLIFKKFGRWVVILVPIILERLLTTSVRGLLRYWVPRGGENNKSETICFCLVSYERALVENFETIFSF